MQTSGAGISLIESFEGFRAAPYLCPAGVPTIGYGMTIYPDGRSVTLRDRPITEAQATAGLRALLQRYEAAVTRYVQVPIDQWQFDALVAFAYNVGIENLRTSTLLKMLNQGNKEGAANQFLRWDKSGGRTLAGLTRRRQAERALFLQGGAA
ncbi:lysozyme [Brachymonas sp.]|uniref:lysozyme n=1 Tax=Brachymonas sp. TaxID=1936292 RepID=UPI0035B1A2FD